MLKVVKAPRSSMAVAWERLTVWKAELSVSGKRSLRKGVCSGRSSRYMTPSKACTVACTLPSVVMVLLMPMVRLRLLVSLAEIPCSESTASSSFCWAILGMATRILAAASAGRPAGISGRDEAHMTGTTMMTMATNTARYTHQKRLQWRFLGAAAL